jgi:RNA polymerase sigma factor (sigma-70 family)
MLKSKVNKEKELVKKIKEDKKYFSDLYNEYYPLVLGYFRRRVSGIQTSEDLSSEVFEKVLKAIDDYKWQGVTLSAWIFKIARNLLTDYYRKKGSTGGAVSLTEVEDIVRDPEISVISDAIADEEERALYDALREFREEDQYLIYYKFFEELSNKEIAQLTGLAESNVGTRLYRIRNKLKSFLKNIQ